MVKDSVGSGLKWIGCALAYALTSVLIITVNKSVLSIYAFPSVKFLSVVQLTVTVIVIQLLKFGKLVSFPDLSITNVRKVMPLPILYMLNMMVGLGSTQSLSIAMFTVLRRFTVLFVMIGEIVILQKRFSVLTMVTVFAMIFGVIVASLGDLAFELSGYFLILTNDALTAAYSIYIKKIDDNKSLGRLGMMYYNSIVSLPLAILIFLASGDTVSDFEGWSDPWFCFEFFACNMLGFILIYSSILCTTVCGALTQNVVGVLKNTVMTYFGMWYGGDYIFSWVNFTGITISAFGGVVYSYVTFTGRDSPSAVKKKQGATSIA